VCFVTSITIFVQLSIYIEEVYSHDNLNQLLSLYTVALRLRDSRKLFRILRAQKCEAPLFLFAINLIRFFRAYCQTLSKTNRVVFFCHESLIK
jgi:hypothetical protein